MLSSAKRYDLSLRIDGRIRRVLGIGAVFTAPAHRGRGCARELLTRMLETAVAEGQEFAMLFSEIAPAFYEQLDFVPVPLLESTLEVDQKRGGAPAMLVRSGDDRDIPAIVEMSAARSADARLALDRSEDLIRFGITRKRLLSGLAPSGFATPSSWSSKKDIRPSRIWSCTEQDGRWMIEEAGDRDPSGARLGAMLQVMLARLPERAAAGDQRWWPQALVPPQLKIAAATPTQEVLMIRPLRDRMLPLPPLAASGSGVLARGLLLIVDVSIYDLRSRLDSVVDCQICTIMQIVVDNCQHPKPAIEIAVVSASTASHPPPSFRLRRARARASLDRREELRIAGLAVFETLHRDHQVVSAPGSAGDPILAVLIGPRRLDEARLEGPQLLVGREHDDGGVEHRIALRVGDLPVSARDLLRSARSACR